MTDERTLSLCRGKWARKREEFLCENAPEMYREFIEEGDLLEHLAYVEDNVRSYVERCVIKVVMSEEYEELRRRGAYSDMAKMVETEKTVSEFDAASMYVYVMPPSYYEDTYEEESDEEE